MEFKEYSKAVMAWVDGVMQNRGADAEKTLKYCADIEQYAKQTGDPKLLGFAYYYAGETYYVQLKEVNSLRFDEERKKTGGRLSSCLFYIYI